MPAKLPLLVWLWGREEPKWRLLLMLWRELWVLLWVLLLVLLLWLLVLLLRLLVLLLWLLILLLGIWRHERPGNCVEFSREG